MTTVASVSLGRPRPLRWTGEAFDRAAEGGSFDGQRVELINGEILERAPMNDAHASAIQNAHYALLAIFPPTHATIRAQCPMRLGDARPFPDFVVINAPPRMVRKHPTTAMLVVEISDTSLEFDQTDKAALYAAPGIPEYWIVNLKNRCLEVRRTPGYGPGIAPHYAEMTIFAEEQEVSPLGAAAATVRVADLLNDRDIT